MLISDEYRKLNEQLHTTNAAYGVNGGRNADVVMEICNKMGSKDVLDYGCGKHGLKNTLGFDIKEYDPAIPGYEQEPEPADIVVCADVMEHIEPENLIDVVEHLESLTKKVIYLVIATRPAIKTLADGRNAHLIVEPVNFWVRLLSRVFDFQQIDNKGGEVTFLCSKKFN